MPGGLWCTRTQAHNTRRYEHPSSAVLALSGWGNAELRLYGVLRSWGYSTRPVPSPDGPPTPGSGHASQPSQMRCPSALVYPQILLGDLTSLLLYLLGLPVKDIFSLPS